MAWFQGSVQEAVNLSKENDGLLIIFVRDNTPLSETMTEAFADSEIGDFFEDHRSAGYTLVLLRIEHGTQDYHNLHSIYAVTAVPMIQFIDARGFQLFSVKPENREDILVGLREGVETWRKEQAPEAGSHRNSAVSNQNRDTQSQPVNSMSTENSGGETQVREVPVEDDIQARVAYAQKRAAEIREKKEKEAREAEKEKEAQRRKDQKLAAQAERERAEKLAEQTRKEMEKERKEEQAHRQKVLDQLKQDREARLSKEASSAHSPSSTSSTPTVPPPSAAIATDYNRSRIQFRLETVEGVRVFVGVFNATDALESVSDFVRKEADLNGKFSLVQMYPRREFGLEDMKTTLRYLGLVPSAVLVVLPAGGSLASKTSGSAGFVQNILNSLRFVLTLPIQGLTYLMGIFFPRPQIRPGGDTRGADVSSGHNADSKTPKTGSLRQRHPDEDATYNGNSTQQL